MKSEADKPRLGVTPPPTLSAISFVLIRISKVVKLELDSRKQNLAEAT